MPSHLDDLIEHLPDEDIADDPDDTLDLYRMGSKPRCEEAEYLALLHEAAAGVVPPVPSPRGAGARRRSHLPHPSARTGLRLLRRLAADRVLGHTRHHTRPRTRPLAPGRAAATR
ncbi:hypothetical protein QNO07_05340 [Streptomyces sp. 549]|uniref:hypothetical protein n=1 Tax=Streptomyces sp. 549 TaxID=3049076 RepID=UPI0024C452EA|nr:hypothetical protein [Streptomyces sp. 549]MDK1472859.1 hypothetical protein [Streptomyces sp. 549]